MSVLWTVVLTVLVFGFLIFIHEFGHYLTARAFGVRINEFSIGMGPQIFSRVSKKTGIRYAFRALPIGGFVSMDGETGDVEGLNDSEADAVSRLTEEAAAFRESRQPFYRKPVWQRILVTIAGGVTNIVIGAIIMLLFISTSEVLGGTVVAEFLDGSKSEEAGLQVMDEVVKVNGAKVDTYTGLMYEIFRAEDGKCELTVLRGKYTMDEDGKVEKHGDYEEVKIPVTFATETESGISYGNMDFKIFRVKKTFGTVLKQTASYTGLAGKMVWQSLWGLVTGRYGLNAVSGPIGTGEVIGEAARTSMSSFLYLVALISINLGVANLLPLPALDGGRLVFQLWELVTGRPVPAKVEGAIHSAGLILLLLLMVVIAFKDVRGLFH